MLRKTGEPCTIQYALGPTVTGIDHRQAEHCTDPTIPKMEPTPNTTI